MLLLGPQLKVREDALDQPRLFDARDHLEPPAAPPALLDVDGEDAFESARLSSSRRVLRAAARQRLLGCARPALGPPE